MQTELELRAHMVTICQRLYARNLLAAGDGNVSCRLDDEHILFTPSGVAKAFITPDQIVLTNAAGEARSGQPSGEKAMHLEVYRRCPRARAVIHAHPPHAVAWSLARPEWRELPGDRLSEVILGAGQIPIAPYARPTTPAMATALTDLLPEAQAIILARHGAICWGESLDEALYGMERIEHSAQILFLAETLGGSTALPADEVAALKAMRAQIGARLL